jgi:hypothetical protein
MFTSSNPSPQPSPRLDGERELFPFWRADRLHMVVAWEAIFAVYQSGLSFFFVPIPCVIYG